MKDGTPGVVVAPQNVDPYEIVEESAIVKIETADPVVRATHTLVVPEINISHSITHDDDASDGAPHDYEDRGGIMCAVGGKSASKNTSQTRIN